MEQESKTHYLCNRAYQIRKLNTDSFLLARCTCSYAKVQTLRYSEFKELMRKWWRHSSPYINKWNYILKML